MKKSTTKRVVSLLKHHGFELIINPITNFYLRNAFAASNAEIHYDYKYGHADITFFRGYQKGSWYLVAVIDNNYYECPGISVTRFSCKNPRIPLRLKLEFVHWAYMERVREAVLGRESEATNPIWPADPYVLKDVWRVWKRNLEKYV